MEIKVHSEKDLNDYPILLNLISGIGENINYCEEFNSVSIFKNVIISERDLIWDSGKNILSDGDINNNRVIVDFTNITQADKIDIHKLLHEKINVSMLLKKGIDDVTFFYKKGNVFYPL